MISSNLASIRFLHNIAEKKKFLDYMERIAANCSYCLFIRDKSIC